MKVRNLTTAAMAVAVTLFSKPSFAQSGAKPRLHVNPRWKECSFQIDPSLTQAAWRQFTEEAGLVVYFRPLADARPMGNGQASEILNSQIGQSFYDFVNGFRVREVQRRIKAGEARTRKMLALAMDAGFASKSTFNDAFKKHTLQTPSDFRQAVGA